MCTNNAKQLRGTLYAGCGQPDFMMRHHTGVQQNRVKPFAPEPSLLLTGPLSQKPMNSAGEG